MPADLQPGGTESPAPCGQEISASKVTDTWIRSEFEEVKLYVIFKCQNSLRTQVSVTLEA